MSAPPAQGVSVGASVSLALFGEPLDHSLSPKLQAAHARWLGLSCGYHLLPSSAEGFAERLREAKALGVIGANVTAPHKALAAQGCDVLTERAARLGVVNTLTWLQEGELEGHNTDVDGLLLSFELLAKRAQAQAAQAQAAQTKFERVRLIGGGGAARAVAWSALERGVEALEVFTRRPKQAEHLCAWLREAAEQSGRALPKLSLVRELSSVPPALTVLSLPPLSEVELERLLGRGEAVSALLDLNYGARAEVSRAWAMNTQRPYLDGALMLAEQGRRSFERWCGGLPPLSVSLEALGERRLAEEFIKAHPFY